MRILYLVSGIGPPAGWGTEFIQELIFNLSKKGVKATIINPIYKHTHPGWKIWQKEQEDKYGVRIIPLEAPRLVRNNLLFHFILTPIFVTWAAIKILSTEKFDVVHEFSSIPIILFRSLLFKTLFKTPTIFTLSVYNNTLPGKFFWFKILDFAKFYLIPSKEIINQLRKIGVVGKKIIFSPPGINLDLFKTSDKTLARKKLNLPKDKFIISFFGSLTFEKGVNEIIEAAKKLDQSKFNNIFILLASIWKGSSQHELFIKKVHRANLDYLEIRDEYIDIPLLLSASDAIILPQRTGFGATIPPISVIETIAAGKPLIVTNIIGVRELINTQNGILVPPKDSDELSKAIEKICRESTHQNKNTSFIGQYDIERSVKLHLEIYKKS